MTQTIVTLIVLLTGPAATPRDALLVCSRDGRCEATIDYNATSIPLAACLADTWAYLPEPRDEEPLTVLGCSPDGRTVVLDPSEVLP